MSPKYYNGKKKSGKDDNNQQCNEFSSWRVTFLAVVVLLLCCSVIGRLYFLQVEAHSFYQGIAENQHIASSKILPHRGEIFLREKEEDDFYPVAVNRDLATAYAVPREIAGEKIDEISEKISAILELDKSEVAAKLSKKDDVYELLKRQLSEEKERQIKELDYKGIYLAPESWRYYPGENLAAQTIGFVGYNEDKLEGIYGLESYYEEDLKGEKGFLRQERDAGGRWISVGEKHFSPPEHGRDLILNIDHVIQFKAEMALRNAVKKHDADGGRLVVMDPYTGGIIAMAEEPSFDLNNYSQAKDMSVYRNSLVSDTYECGSIFKTFTMAAGLDSGAVEYDETYIDKGQVIEAGYTIKNSDEKSYGEQTMTEVLEKSLNTGAIYVQQKLGNEKFKNYIEKFGFGKKTDIDLPQEAVGNVSNLKTNRDIEFFTASFGQGITVTPIQVASAYAAIANGGELMSPRVVDYSRSFENGGISYEIGKNIKRKVVSKDTANKLSLMLENNVKNGHGKQAGVPGHRIAGKTGTAQIADKEKRGYVEDATVGSFAGFGPVDNPKFAMLVVVDNPKDVLWAESTAAPIFGELARFMLEYWGVNETEDFSKEDVMRFNQSHNYINYQEEEKDEEKSEDNNEEAENND